MATYVLLLGSLSVAAYFFLMLGIAIIGLFLRPNIEKTIAKTVEVALMLAAVLLGMLLVYGINLSGGLVMGAAAFGAQILVGFLLTFGLSKKDRVHIAFAQQNGITAIILALLFESSYPGTVAIVAPAILVTNTLHFVTNKLLDNYAVPKASAEEAAS